MNNYIDTANRWSIALRTLIGYPLSAPLTDAVMFTTSGRYDDAKDRQLAQMAVDAEKDIIHLGIDEDGALPTASLYIRYGATVRVFSGLQVYSPDDTSPIQLLADGSRWSVGPRYILTEHKLPSATLQKRGRAIATRRWQELFEAMGPVVLKGSKFVKLGDRFADAIPFEELNIAA